MQDDDLVAEVGERLDISHRITQLVFGRFSVDELKEFLLTAHHLVEVRAGVMSEGRGRIDQEYKQRDDQARST